MTPEEKKEAVLDRWARGVTQAEIARQLGLSSAQYAGTIINRARFNGDPRARSRKRGPKNINRSEYFITAAAQRGLTPDRLSERLLEVICRERMVDAILDDQHQ